MDNCQTPEAVNDGSFSSLCDNTHLKVSEVDVIMDENISVEKEDECNPKSDNDILSDNFIVDLLSRDSTTHAELSEQKVESRDSFGKNASPSATDSFEIDTLGQSKPNDMVVSESEISLCDKFETVNKENSVATSEREAEVAEGPPSDKEKCKTDCELRPLEVTQSNSVNEVFEVEMIKEVVIKDSSRIDVEKEQPAESIAKNTYRSAYRCESNSSTDDEDSTTSDSSSSDSSFFKEMCERSKPKKLPFVKTKGELGLDDLPPIEDLAISVNEGETSAIGKIYAVVEKLVVIRALKGMKALDLDSVLFLSHEQPLGRVFDVFGPVNEPFYSVRFNTVDEINKKGVKVGAEVFFAPEKSDITSYVFVEELQNQKGSDASWKHNNEPPEEFLDFSDDEKEKSAKQQRRQKNRNRQFNSSDAPAKRPLLTNDSSNYIPPPKPTRGWNHSQNISLRVSRPNPFQSHIPPMSPSPSVCSLMSPVRAQNPFASSPNRPRRSPQPQNVIYRSSPQLLISPYQQPHVFGQVAVLNQFAPSPLHSPVMNNVPALIPASPFSAPQNYFGQAFSRSPSPSTHAQHMPLDPWISNRSHHSNIPPSHPLTVQIPSMNNPSLPMHQFPQERGPMQPFLNFPNGNFNEPFVNNNRNFPNGNMQSRFYR